MTARRKPVNWQQGCSVPGCGSVENMQMKRKVCATLSLLGAGAIYLAVAVESSPRPTIILRNQHNIVQSSFSTEVDPSVEATSMVADDAEVVHTHRIFGPTRNGKECLVRQEANGKWQVICERGRHGAITYARNGVIPAIEWQ